MITSVVMPQMGLEVTEGTVVEVLVEVGAVVAKDDSVMVVATDKADADIGASAAGIVRSIEVAVGDTVEIGATLIVLADSAGEPLDGEPAHIVDAPAELGAAVRSADPLPSDVTTRPPTDGLPRLRAAPVARRAAIAHGIALEAIEGTGPRGRITLKDVERAAGAGLEPLSPLRRAVARRMTTSQRDVPQYQLVRDVDATHLLAQKAAVSAGAAAAPDGGTKPGVNELLVQAIAETLRRHPDVAAAYVEDDGVASLRRPESIDVGLAVATEGGLLVPVLRRAHERSLRELATERTRLVGAARSGNLGLAEMAGGAVSLSNLGGFGVDHFTAMVNPGQSAIVAVGRVLDRVVPKGRGIAVIPVLTITVSFDHRVVDGATGARALAELAELLEGAMPWRI